MLKRVNETHLTKKEALNDARAIRQRLEQEYNSPFEVKKAEDEIKNVDDLFDFYGLYKSHKFKMEWNSFKKMWMELDLYVKDEFYNYIYTLCERDGRDMDLLRARLAEGLIECMDDNEMLVQKVIKFTNDDVPKFFKKLRRAERYSLEHPSKLKFMTSAPY